MTDYVVTSTADAGHGSLRDALERANANGSGRITFCVGSGPLVLRPLSPLPLIAFTGEIDCRSQPGYAGSPIVEISGADVDRQSESAGLEIVGSGVVVRGAALTDWPTSGVFMREGGSNALFGVYLGVRLDGRTSGGNGRHGIHFKQSQDNRIGGPEQDELVVSSGNKAQGIAMNGGHRARISNSRFGTDASGRHIVPNGASGVSVFDSDDVIVGGPGAHRTVVSGNTQYGVGFSGASSRCRLIGTHVGCDVDGLVALPNLRSGVLIFNAPGNFIGGESPQDGNVIAGGKRSAINIDGSTNEGVIIPWAGLGTCRFNTVVNNLIGVDSTGEAPLSNQLRNILINHAQDSDIRGNVIGGTSGEGVMVLGLEDDSDVRIVPARNRIRGNLIGVSRGGVPLPIGRHGVYVQHGRETVVGGPEANDANTIRHCAKRGVTFRGIGWDTNVLAPGNKISDNGQGAYHAAP